MDVEISSDVYAIGGPRVNRKRLVSTSRGPIVSISSVLTCQARSSVTRLLLRAQGVGGRRGSFTRSAFHCGSTLPMVVRLAITHGPSARDVVLSA